MSSDSHHDLAADADRRRVPGAPLPRGIRDQFFADVQEHELWLLVLDDRLDRLAARPEQAFQTFRHDTVLCVQTLAAQASTLDAAGALDPHQRRRVAALLTVMRRRIALLDERRAQRQRGTGRRARDGPDRGMHPLVRIPS
ncbi:hypothetical protein [Agromyces mangrovi Wang et al. 2018]|uniref:hypothetical protein n=1 Tax=Agromyces mangrovi TaxID=1858653 RepID=UPI002572692C|nr:hypothetical protein [Agromyces mangrovi]BDZ64116.1 hypothetical protein GCM10025877_10540 [Agromyces mangrovi]